MSVDSNTLNAAMNLAAGVLAVIAALLSLLIAAIPRGEASSRLATLLVRARRALPQFLSIIGVITFAFIPAQRVGLCFLVIALLLVSIQFLRREGPASRAEIFSIVFQFFVFLSFLFLHYLWRLMNVLDLVMDALSK